VADGQLLEGIDFVLPRGAVIAGRVTDEFGEPVADAMVQPCGFSSTTVSGASPPRDGARRPTTSGITGCTDFSQGTTSSVPRDGAQLALPPGAASLGASEGTVGFAPTYFPGTPSVAEAQRVTVGVGDVGQADFQLVPVPVAASRARSSTRPASRPRR